MSNLYQRMTQTLALHMGDTLLVREQFQEAIVRISELEKELAESARISKSWKVQWENLLQDERKEKVLRCSMQYANSELEEKNEMLRTAARNFLTDLAERVSRDGRYYPSETVRDYFGNGKVLPVGNGVLFALDEALKK